MLGRLVQDRFDDFLKSRFALQPLSVSFVATDMQDPAGMRMAIDSDVYAALMTPSSMLLGIQGKPYSFAFKFFLGCVYFFTILFSPRHCFKGVSGQ